MDAAWVFRSGGRRLAFLDGVRGALAWFEDDLPAGDAEIVARLRERTDVPIAMGDEQGGSYCPEALLLRRGPSTSSASTSPAWGNRPADDRRLRGRGTAWAPHMFAHVHSQVFAPRLRHRSNGACRGTGVDQFADSLARPTLVDGGLMEPLPVEHGFRAAGRRSGVARRAGPTATIPDGLVAELNRR
jgi:hypothetical protein